jgi:hypothetical protein
MMFVRSQWCDRAEQVLGHLIHKDVKPFLLDAVKSGAATLWKVQGDNWETWLLTRVEKFGDTRELVLEAIDGSHCHEIVRRVFKVAKNAGVSSVRFETHHAEKVAGRFVAGLGFERVATVFRAQL